MDLQDNLVINTENRRLTGTDSFSPDASYGHISEAPPNHDYVNHELWYGGADLLENDIFITEIPEYMYIPDFDLIECSPVTFIACEIYKDIRWIVWYIKDDTATPINVKIDVSKIPDRPFNVNPAEAEFESHVWRNKRYHGDVL